ncbi:MAG: hypothetical protein ACI4L6_00055 [Candidatus Onthoplasma sp.]
MKKIFSYVLAVCLILPGLLLFSACNKNETKESRVMTVSANPSVEFILNEDDKVVTVNAANDDGNFIIASVSFTGLSAKEAVNLFLQTANQNGFIVEDNAIKIEISGENAENLFNSIKESAKTYLSNINVQVNVEFKQIDKNDLKSLLKECMQELSLSEINNYSEQEIISLLKQSREETKNLFSEELKEFYYSNRAEEIISSKIQKINSLISSNLIVDSTIKSQIESYYQIFTEKFNEFKETYAEYYLDSESDYQVKMQEYISAKQALLEARLNSEQESVLAELEQQVELTKTALNNAKVSADNALAIIKSAMDNALQGINSLLNVVSHFLNQNEISGAMKDAKDNFENNFNSTYGDYINNKYWNNLKPETK